MYCKLCITICMQDLETYIARYQLEELVLRLAEDSADIKHHIKNGAYAYLKFAYSVHNHFFLM